MDSKVMTAEQTRLEDDSVKVTIKVDAAEVDRQVKEAYRGLARKYRFKGFRAGKAPRAVIDRVLGREVGLASATDEVVSQSYPHALDACDISPLSEPELGAEKFVEEGQPYEFSFTVKVKPEIELSSFEPVQVTLPSDSATDEDIQAQLDVLRSYQYTFEEVLDRKVEQGDYLVLDMDAQSEGEKVESLCSKSRIYQLGSGVLPQAFDDELVGCMPGEAIQFTLSPQDGIDQEAPVDFTVTVCAIREKKFADFDDDFAKKCGADSMEDLKSKLAEGITSNKQAARPRLKEQACLAALRDRVEEDPSEEMVSASQAELAQQLFMQLQRSGMTLDAYLARHGMSSEEFREDLARQAQDSAKESLALDSIARHLHLEVSEDDLRGEFAQALEDGEGDAEQSFEEWKSQGRLPQLREALLRQKASEWLVDNAVVTEGNGEAGDGGGAEGADAGDGDAGETGVDGEDAAEGRACAPEE